ncbi:hypothetical protein KJ781_01805 [Patescibacteria group bacterium]|nr:hypothetical protein [Patescibacteria group bacterium]MBU2613712.1 hypothetical protein [Patescibacteria group bacterium]
MPCPKGLKNAKPGMLTERRTHPMRAVWSGVAAVLLVVLSIPLFVDAIEGQTMDASPLGTQTTALVAALGTLGEQVSTLRSDITALRSALTSQKVGASSESTLKEGMPECLQACRAKLATCLGPEPPTAAPVRITRLMPTTLLAKLVPLDACRTDANTCMNQCRPRTTTILTCEDRCAVALGGCVDAAGLDATRLADCRRSNQQCLVAACTQASPDQESMDRIPTSKCADQCQRALSICRSGEQFDQKAIEACEASLKVCLTTMCSAPATRLLPISDTGAAAMQQSAAGQGTVVPAPTGAAPTGASSGQVYTVQCDNACTATFLSCREIYAATPELLPKCDNSYGACREACLKGIDGGYDTTVPATDADVSRIVIPPSTSDAPTTDVVPVGTTQDDTAQ